MADVMDHLVAANLPDMIKNLGLAVAKANHEMAKPADPNAKTVYAIEKAEIELAVTFSFSRDQQIGGQIGGSVFAFAVNASYKATFGFREEASSKIKLVLSAKPVNND